MGMELRLSQRLNQELTLQQKQELKHQQSQRLSEKQELSLLLRLELRSPAPLEAIRGMEGVIKANEILKEKKRVGILIGGLARKVWERTSGPEDFLRKDVDVLVLEENEEDNITPQIKYGEGGIDWWLPGKKFVKYTDRNGSWVEGSQKFYKNINGVILNFYASSPEKNIPGLYLLNLNQLIALQFTESSAAIKGSVINDEVGEKFEEHLRRSYQKVPSRHMIEGFGNNFIDSIIFDELNSYLSDAIKKQKEK